MPLLLRLPQLAAPATQDPSASRPPRRIANSEPSRRAPLPSCGAARRLRARARTIARSRSIATDVIWAAHAERPPSAGKVLCGVGGWCGLWDWLPGREAERFGVGPAVVLSEHLAGVAWPVRNGAAADLTGRDRKTGNGHRETAGTWAAHRLQGATVPEWPCAVTAAVDRYRGSSSA